MIEWIIILPWCASLAGHSPLTYLQGVGMWASLAGFLITPFAAVAWVIETFRESRWILTAICAYYWFLYWIFT